MRIPPSPAYREWGEEPRWRGHPAPAMSLPMRRIAALFWLLVALPAAAADPALGEGDRAAIRGVIERQLGAFQRDDASAAFAFASPSIQDQFATADNFMRMVRQGYLPVYRPREVSFGALVEIEGQLVQRVLLVGPDGAPVMALYMMERQPDGSWRINGCILTQSDDKAT
jgi:hypothetical protein